MRKICIERPEMIISHFNYAKWNGALIALIHQIFFSTKYCHNLILNQHFKKVGFEIQSTHCGFLRRPLLCEGLFSINHLIYDFVGDIAAFCLDIKEELLFFMFQCFT